MQNVFQFRDQMIQEYTAFSRSLTKINARDIAQHVEAEYQQGH